VSVFGVVAYEGLDERADRDDLEASLVGVVEGASDECRAEAAPLLLWVDLGVEEREYAAAAIAEDEFAGMVAGEEEDVAALLLMAFNGEAGHDLFVGRAVDSADEERHLVDMGPVPVFAGLE
jgi:hypothetical protein